MSQEQLPEEKPKPEDTTADTTDITDTKIVDSSDSSPKPETEASTSPAKPTKQEMMKRGQDLQERVERLEKSVERLEKFDDELDAIEDALKNSNTSTEDWLKNYEKLENLHLQTDNLRDERADALEEKTKKIKDNIEAERRTAKDAGFGYDEFIPLGAGVTKLSHRVIDLNDINFDDKISDLYFKYQKQYEEKNREKNNKSSTIAASTPKPEAAAVNDATNAVPEKETPKEEVKQESKKEEPKLPDITVSSTEKKPADPAPIIPNTPPQPPSFKKADSPGKGKVQIGGQRKTDPVESGKSVKPPSGIAAIVQKALGKEYDVIDAGDQDKNVLVREKKGEKKVKMTVGPDGIRVPENLTDNQKLTEDVFKVAKELYAEPIVIFPSDAKEQAFMEKIASEMTPPVEICVASSQDDFKKRTQPEPVPAPKKIEESALKPKEELKSAPKVPPLPKADVKPKLDESPNPNTKNSI